MNPKFEDEHKKKQFFIILLLIKTWIPFEAIYCSQEFYLRCDSHFQKLIEKELVLN